MIYITKYYFVNLLAIQTNKSIWGACNRYLR